MLISRPRRFALPVLLAALSIGVLAAKSVGAVDCGTVATAQSSQHHPPYSGTIPNLLTTAGSDDYIYTATEWGFARATISASGTAGPLQLLQIGKKYVPGDNGGLIYMACDCYQGASTFDAAEAPDGSSRMVSDWVATASGVLKGMLGQTAGVGAPAFGDQLNINQVALGSNVAAVYHPASGKYFGYFPSNNGLQILDLTNPNGSVDPLVALNPIGSFGWAGVGILKAGKVTVQGIPKIVLAGYIGGTSTLRIAEVGSDGMPVEKASHASMGPNALYIANVNGKAYVFSADNASGLNVYEYTGSALNFAGNLPGYFNNVVVKGNPGGNYPAIFLHRSLKILPTDPSDGVDIWDSKWLTAGTPQRAYTLAHQGSAPPTGRGNAIEAVVTGSGSQIIAHVFRLATTTNPIVNPEHLLLVDHIDVSCIAADTTSPPTANATFVNKSALLRAGVEATINYYGDRFVFTDTSGTGVPITRVDWDLATAGNTQGDFAPDPALGITSSIGGLNGFVFPCDPSIATTDPSTGFNCRQSLALPATPGAASFKFGEKSSNVNGPATNAFFSAGIPFQMPAAKVANLVGGTLSILTGGSADSTPSQGHPIGWHWTFSGGSGGSSSLPVAPVPNGTTSFNLSLDYEGGYSATTNGNVVITDLVPSFSMNPSTVGLALPVTLTNTMQIASGAVVTAVDSSVVAGTCPGTPNFTGNLQSGFNQQGGTSPLTAPGTAGTYCVTLQFHYTPAAGVPTISPTKPFQQLTVANAAMTGTVTGPTTGNPNQSYTFTANITGGLPPLSYEWDCNYPLFGTPNWTAPTAVNTTPCSWTIGGGHTIGVRVTDSSTPTHSTATFTGTITLTGGGGGSLSASVSGPSSGSVGTANTFFASATGGQGGYSFAWACDYSVLGGSGQFTPGQQTNACTYSSNGSHVVAVRVTDSASATAIGSTTISIGGGGGPGPGGLSVGVTGPSTGSANSALTYTAAASGGTPPYTYAWACDYSVVGGTGQFVPGNSTKACTFTGNGVHIVAARVTDSATNSVQNTASTNIAGLGLPSIAFTVTGATMSGNVVTVGLGQPVTFTSSEPNCSQWGWDFGDATGGTGRSITKTYPAKGTFTGTLIVIGNGTGASGQNIGNFTINVVTPPPSGAFTITGAQSNGNGTVFMANVGDQLTLTALETHAISYSWDFGDSTAAVSASPTANKGYGTLGSYTVRLFVVGDERNTTGTVISTFTINVVSCAGNASTLCLNDSRFRATVNWAVPDQGKSGSGNAVVLTADTGYYWFFSPTNIELVLKVVDGRAFNGNFWVFYGALSDVQYDITIKDTSSGVTKTYHNPYHTTASVADVDAFPGGGSVAEPAKKTLATSAISVQCTPSTVTVGQPISCTASPASGTYSWDWGAFPPSYAAGPNPNTHTFSTAGTQRVTVTTDGGITTGSTTVAVTAAGSGGIVPAISGPSTGTTASTLSYDGSATGGTPPYSYAWNCDYSALNPSFTAGSQSNPCTYTDIGLHTIGLKVTDSAAPAASATTTTTVTISAPAGPGLPSAAFTVSGATLNSATNRYEAEVGRPVTFTATETNAASWGWAFGDGASAGGANPSDRTVTYSYPQLGSWNGQLIVTGDTVHTVGLNIGAIPISVLRCAAGANTLCLNGGRFKVQVAWRSAESSGVGTAVPVTSDTGQFWFITSNNVELVIKVVDGTSFNGHYWVFYGALSNLEYDITVTDTTTGSVKTYHNPLGTTASLADVEAF